METSEQGARIKRHCYMGSFQMQIDMVSKYTPMAPFYDEEWEWKELENLLQPSAMEYLQHHLPFKRLPEFAHKAI